MITLMIRTVVIFALAATLSPLSRATASGIECRAYNFETRTWLNRGPIVRIPVEYDAFFDYDYSAAFEATVIPEGSNIEYPIHFDYMGPSEECREHPCQGEPTRFKSVKYRMDVNVVVAPEYVGFDLRHNRGSRLFPRWVDLGSFKCVSR